MGFSVLDNYPAFVLGWGYRNIIIVFHRKIRGYAKVVRHWGHFWRCTDNSSCWTLTSQNYSRSRHTVDVHVRVYLQPHCPSRGAEGYQNLQVAALKGVGVIRTALLSSVSLAILSLTDPVIRLRRSRARSAPVFWVCNTHKG